MTKWRKSQKKMGLWENAVTLPLLRPDVFCFLGGWTGGFEGLERAVKVTIYLELPSLKLT